MPEQSDNAPPGGRLAAAANPSLARLVDALLNFAINPESWDAFISELGAHEKMLDELDPRELLASLSKAESLAWRLQHEEAGGFAYSYIILDEAGRAIAHADDDDMAEFVDLELGAPPRFVNEASTAHWRDAKASLSPSRGHVLFEIANAAGDERRFAYLVDARDFPAARAVHDHARLALLFAPLEASDKLARVLKSSFALTDAEVSLTVKLAQGLSLKEFAASHSISVNTARNQLQSVFEKSGISRQPDLILVVTQLSIILAINEKSPATTKSRPSEGDYPPHEFEILSDARQLAFRCYGSEGGRPVIYLHETYGSSRLPPGTQALADELGLLIVAVERPGSGFSTPNANLSFETFAADVCEFVDSLAIEQLSMIGFLSGSAYALFCAAALGPRVEQLTLVAGRTPVLDDGEHVPRLLASTQRRLARNPWLLNTFLNILRNRSSHDLNKRLALRVYGSVPADNDYLQSNPLIWDHLAAYTMESVAVSSQGAVGDMRSFTQNAQCDLDAITAPIYVWHGAADVVADSKRLATYLGDRVTKTHLFEDLGALVLFRHWGAILREIAAQPR